jgi:hypothetical protein
MTFNRFGIFAASVAAMVAGAIIPANAQNYRAKVTLPFETQWGGAVLPAGNYVLTTEAVMTAPTIHVSGEGININVLAGPVNLTETTDRGGQLEITDVNGTHVVTKLHAGFTGKDFSFAIPKALKAQGYGVAALHKAALPVSGR